MKRIFVLAALLFALPAFAGVGPIAGKKDHPYKGTWYLADTSGKGCSYTKGTPKTLVAYLENSRIEQLAKHFYDGGMYGHCSSYVKELTGDEDGYLAGDKDTFSCAIASPKFGFIERYRLYANKSDCDAFVKSAPFGSKQ